MTSVATGPRIRVSISASSAVRRAGLESIIANSSIAKLVGSTYELEALSRQLRQFQPDVHLADLEGADSRLLTRSPQLDEQDATLSIVALIDDPEPGWIHRALRAQVKAVLNRNAPAEDILRAVQSVFSGLVVLEPELVHELLRSVRPIAADATHASSERLTSREIQVLQLLAEGVGNKAIASRLNISEHTVKFHISSVLSKLGAESRTEAVTQGIRNGLIVI